MLFDESIATGAAWQGAYPNEAPARIAKTPALRIRGVFAQFGPYRDQWIVEALANYSSMMVLEAENPALRAVMEKLRDDLLEKNKSGCR